MPTLADFTCYPWKANFDINFLPIGPKTSTTTIGNWKEATHLANKKQENGENRF
jgi:hypothetical protein